MKDRVEAILAILNVENELIRSGVYEYARDFKFTMWGDEPGVITLYAKWEQTSFEIAKFTETFTNEEDYDELKTTIYDFITGYEYAHVLIDRKEKLKKHLELSNEYDEAYKKLAK